MYEAQDAKYVGGQGENSLAPKQVSPVEQALQSLNKEQEETHALLDKLQARLSVLLRTPTTEKDGASISQAPESPLHESIMSRRDCAVGLNRRIIDLTQRLTV